jgi:uncharacterized protein with PIN domain
VILTRDRALSDRPLAGNHLLIKSDFVQQQVEQVLSAFPLESLLNPLSRCSGCNEPLDRITREEARDLVPQYVYENKDLFLRCPRCRRTYWHGTHVRRMVMTKQRIK